MQEATADDLLFPVAYQLADLCRLITLEPGDVLLTGTPANSRPMEPGDVVEVEIAGLGRLTNTRRRMGRRPDRAGRAARGDGEHDPRRARRSPRTRPSGWRRGRRVIRLRRIDHVCLRVDNLDEARLRWSREFGLLDRGGDGGRALLSCEDEPYSLELVGGRARATTTRPSSSPATARSTRPTPHLDAAGVDVGRSSTAALHPVRPGRARRSQLLPLPRAGAVGRACAPLDARAAGRAAQARPRQLPDRRLEASVRFYTRRARDAASATGSAPTGVWFRSTPTTT